MAFPSWTQSSVMERSDATRVAVLGVATPVPRCQFRRSTGSQELNEGDTTLAEKSVAASPHALRFRQLLKGLTSSEEQLAFVEGLRLRQMLRGVNAIAASGAVALAFENLYEDLAPVRFACDVLFWRLERPLAEAAKRSSAVLPSVEPETSPEDLAAARELFEILDQEPCWWRGRGGWWCWVPWFGEDPFRW
eukprot:Skav215216  [mRNA]  locus=scaffold1252:186113:195333:- [translate_table: standard]